MRKGAQHVVYECVSRELVLLCDKKSLSDKQRFTFHSTHPFQVNSV